MIFSDATCKVWTPRILGIMRIIVGFLYVQHGTAKLFGIPHIPMFDGLQLLSLLGLAGVLELVGGTLILIGLLTRPAAFILSGEMAVAYFMAHAPQGFLPILNQGELAVLYCFLFLYLSVSGAGAYSVDEMLAHHHPTGKMQTT
ncbi:DoxX family protein [Sideroxydans lithotrophicus ES-1]|uniref:DoxX family protein n=2 Tax=Sideroxydans TaxID=314343 RepID=D5CUM3_SIDLE|nr:DoxX family protein [Sideroxydans lithotrophicus ES-1]